MYKINKDMKHLKRINENIELGNESNVSGQEIFDEIDTMSLKELQHALDNIGELFSKFGCVPGEDPSFDEEVQEHIVDTMRPHIRKAIADAGFDSTDANRHSAY